MDKAGIQKLFIYKTNLKNLSIFIFMIYNLPINTACISGVNQESVT